MRGVSNVPDIASMSLLEALFYIPIMIFLLCLYVYIIYLLIIFLRRGIRFFDHQEEDRNYKQWLARQSKDDSEKNG